MCNCGCRNEWVEDGKGCVIGGGIFRHESLPCTNYWMPKDASPECHAANTSTLHCVGNLTSKIEGDDTEHILDVFEDFLERQVETKKPFLAELWLHTVHIPHPAMPEWYHAYVDVYGNPAGDDLGTISQMDVQIGRLRSMLRKHGIANDTILFFTADNGPHVPEDLSVHASTLGLRQCKASVFEGGIRVPGMVEWPGGIRSNRLAETLASVLDFLPTFLDWMGVAHPHPHWEADGESLVPILTSTSASNRSRELGFRLGSQVALVTRDGRYKLVKSPSKGMCALEETSYLGNDKKGPFLFDLLADPTESTPLNDELPELFEELVQKMEEFEQSITQSQVYESECLPASAISTDLRRVN